ncbi:hypothetical protein GOARA_011_00240 [Gordonia araii NBRC 100433]|uniref:Glycosyltransferase 2-like domain-containing protein n=1 Tax=Gordonia araii NBRC 100433 TaxID=1073574 RepID=G7GXT3_9ACTN|nr:mycofactocin biosynthesis glycosyltransferase MftF [Gordonia araii]GAB08408.1 hypothetical protein GOARA_011_00240 [Gordonia araii NBRC 100433]
MTPTDTALPKGFQAQIDLRCARDRDWRHLVGGAPTRLLRLSERAAGMVSAEGRITVLDDASGELVRTLLDANVAHPRPMFGPHDESVTVVIPVRDNQPGVDRLLRAVHGLRVIVVDDGSAAPITVPEDVRLLRFDTNRGPSAARNHGVAQADTEFVIFLDSDVVPLATPGAAADWVTALTAHFSDPAVGLVAPRIVGLPAAEPNLVERYEAGFSSLDMGQREAAIKPGSRVPYVPSAAMVVRRRAFTGFDEDLRVAEDVDLCWRMAAQGWCLRYDPVARVAHEHRSTLPSMLGRRRYYGTGAAFLADRHQRKAAPLAMRWPIAVAVVALLTRTRLGLAVGLLGAGYAGWAVRRRLGEMPGRDRVAASLTGQALAHGLVQAGGAVCRHYWPIGLVTALVSRRFRVLAAQVAVVDAVVAWIRHAQAAGRSPKVDPLSFLVLRRLDDLAYGTGLWQGALAQRDATALLPVIGR